MDNDNNDKKLSKAEQFIADVGLHFDTDKLKQLGLKKKADKTDAIILPFISSLSMRMDKPEHALALHIQNLVVTYGIDKVKAEINKTDAIKAISDDADLWVL